jgi:hypothetical protein
MRHFVARFQSAAGDFWDGDFYATSDIAAARRARDYGTPRGFRLVFVMPAASSNGDKNTSQYGFRRLRKGAAFRAR